MQNGVRVIVLTNGLTAWHGKELAWHGDTLCLPNSPVTSVERQTTNRQWRFLTLNTTS